MRRTDVILLWSLLIGVLIAGGANWLFGGLPWWLLALITIMVGAGCYAEWIKMAARETIINSPTITPKR